MRGRAARRTLVLHPELTEDTMSQTPEAPGLASRLDARLYDAFVARGERNGMAEHRRSVLAAARGRVLEIGAGTGLNLAHYPDGIDELVLTEPEPGMAARLRARVA